MKQKLEQIIRETLDDAGVNLVDLEIKGHKPTRSVQIYIASETGISVTDCANVSRSLWDRLEHEEIELFKSISRLEVSSPGLDRPLQTQADFQRNIGRNVQIKYTEESVVKSVEGTIVAAEPSFVQIKPRTEAIDIAYSDIKKAVIQLQWK